MPKLSRNAQKYYCERGCKLAFGTVRQRLNHYRYCCNSQSIRQPAAQQSNETIDSYDSIFMSYNNEQAEPLKYNICSSEANIFTKSELFSMVFQDITNTYSIPREATREIVRLFKSMLEDNLLSNNVPLENALCELKYSETLSNIMERETPIKPIKHEVCINGCMLYPKDDLAITKYQNKDCNELRYTSEGTI
ncbi:hypothetical protein INT46_010594 [Mucor plumbeus]|uniref:Uncharacterized protein n=1 Tax=Mucor plumbeus TaxID=97098 RepID=A0A8H7QD59_9FUNG|nr:hypothetical protein INT46_010594 [Mucor plumbeus]